MTWRDELPAALLLAYVLLLAAWWLHPALVNPTASALLPIAAVALLAYEFRS